MIKKVARWVIAIMGGGLGFAIGTVFSHSELVVDWMGLAESPLKMVIPVLFAIILFILLFILSNTIIRWGVKITEKAEFELSKIPTNQMAVGSLGLIIGLIIAYLISSIFQLIPFGFVGMILSVVAYVFFGYLGVTLSTRNIGELAKLPDMFRKNEEKGIVQTKKGGSQKILDTSVIIDGRIADISRTGFIEGTLIIPEFVLEELRHIADSSDGLKRNRGRRGLDILKTIQTDLNVPVKVVDDDFEDVSEVDVKLLKLAQKIGGVVLTNDYNLNKVAAVQDVPVLNINELANAVKPVVLPGEDMQVQIIKAGKEANQGIAYLDDGTMIVVEEGKRHINETVDVVVTSVLQTAAGRMIFTRFRR